MLDRHEVTGSIPVHPTNKTVYMVNDKAHRLFFFLVAVLYQLLSG